MSLLLNESNIQLDIIKDMLYSKLIAQISKSPNFSKEKLKEQYETNKELSDE